MSEIESSFGKEHRGLAIKYNGGMRFIGSISDPNLKDIEDPDLEFEAKEVSLWEDVRHEKPEHGEASILRRLPVERGLPELSNFLTAEFRSDN